MDFLRSASSAQGTHSLKPNLVRPAGILSSHSTQTLLPTIETPELCLILLNALETSLSIKSFAKSISSAMLTSQFFQPHRKRSPFYLKQRICQLSNNIIYIWG